MTFKEYISKNLGKSIDFDGVFGFQCCDLVNDYMQKCFNIFTYYPHNFNAQQYFTRFNEVSALVKNFTKISKNQLQKLLKMTLKNSKKKMLFG